MVDGAVTLAAAGVVKAREHRDAFEQRGFSGAVFAGDDGDRPIELQFEFVAQERQAERIGLAVGDAFGIEPDPPEIWRRQIDRTVSL